MPSSKSHRLTATALALACGLYSAHRPAGAERSGPCTRAVNRTTLMSEFDALEPITDINFLIGQWRGEPLASGHALDGMLELTGWYGKRFHSAEHVDPLMFHGPPWKPSALYPISFPLLPSHPIFYTALQALRNIPTAARPASLTVGKLFEQSRTQARLRTVEFRGQFGLAMVYDAMPVIDHFRRVDVNTIIGVMDEKGDVCEGEQQFFGFRLVRDVADAR